MTSGHSAHAALERHVGGSLWVGGQRKKAFERINGKKIWTSVNGGGHSVFIELE